jgi:hypothetical protein
MADTKELLIELSLENKKLIKSVNETDKKLGKLKKQQNETKGSLSNLKAGYIAIAAVLTGVVAKGFATAFKKASEFEEANSKFGVVFRGVSDEANRMRNELVDSYGVSTIEATKMLSSIQDFLVPMGVARDEALGLSDGFSRLAVDLGSFNDMPTADVLDAIKSGLAGQSEPLRRFGVDVRENVLKKMALAEGAISNMTEIIPPAIRSQLLYKKIMSDSADAQGDFARTMNSTANIMKRAGAIADDVVLIFGQALAKEMQPAIDGLNDFIKTENGLVKIKRAVEAIFVAFRLLILPTKAVINQIKFLVKNAVVAGQSLKDLFSSIAKRDVKGMAKAVKDATTGVIDNTKELVGSTVDDIKRVGADSINLLRELETEAIEGKNLVVENNETGNQSIVESNTLTKEQLKEINDLHRESEKEAEDQTLQDKLNRINILLDAVKKGSKEEEKLLQSKATFEKLINDKRKQQESLLHNAKLFFAKEEVSATRDALSDISSLTESKSRSLFDVGKTAAIATAIINSTLAVIKTMSSVPFPFNIPLAAAQGAVAAVQVNKIRSQKFEGKQHGGVINRVMGSPVNGEDGLIGVQRGEAILTREAVVNLGTDTINRLNQTGGKMGIKPNVNIIVQNNRPEETVAVLNNYFREFGTSRQGVET